MKKIRFYWEQLDPHAREQLLNAVEFTLMLVSYSGFIFSVIFDKLFLWKNIVSQVSLVIGVVFGVICLLIKLYEDKFIWCPYD